MKKSIAHFHDITEMLAWHAGGQRFKYRTTQEQRKSQNDERTYLIKFQWDRSFTYI